MDKTKDEEWYEKINKEFEEERKTQDFSNSEMDKWFLEMLDKEIHTKDKDKIDQWYAEMNRQFEEDSKTQDFRDPEMDKWFYKMLDEEVKKSKKCKIAKVSGIVAGVVLTFGVALSGFTQLVYGESLIEIIRNSIEAGQFTISVINKNDDSQFEEFEDEKLHYEANSIDEIFQMIINDSKAEISQMFYVEGVPGQYKQWTAKYDKEFQTLTINSKQGNHYLYIYEEFNYDDVVSGTILESDVVETVFNKNLQMDISIVKQMDNIRHSGYYLEVFFNNIRLKVEGIGTIEEFEFIAKSISLERGIAE